MSALSPLLLLLASLHIPPPCHLEIAIRDEHVDVQVILWAQIFEAWWQQEAATVGGLSTDQFAALARRVEPSLAAKLRLEIDTITVQPNMTQAVYRRGTEATDFVPYIMVRLTYGLKASPRRISFQWDDWATVQSYGLSQVPVLLEAPPDKSVNILSLTAEEPLHTWHTPAPRVVSAPFVVQKARILRLPVVTLALLLLLPLVLAWNSEEGFSRRKIGLAGSVFVLAGLGLLLPPAHITLKQARQRPSDEQAALIFEDLLRNVYRAFDYETESDIYDTLARSVTPEVLDGLYTQIYEGLVMQDEGGARSKPTSVRVEEVTVLASADADQSDYRVRARWVVQGTVTHMGHRHIRTNRHEALYNVVPHGEESWRIGSSEILSKQQVGDDIGVFGIPEESK